MANPPHDPRVTFFLPSLLSLPQAALMASATVGADMPIVSVPASRPATDVYHLQRHDMVAAGTDVLLAVTVSGLALWATCCRQWRGRAD